MARQKNRLTPRTIAAIKKPGDTLDGDGLRVRCSPSMTKSFVLRFRWQGKDREMGLGSVTRVTLADARLAAVEARALVAEGVDPVASRRVPEADLTPVSVPTFGEFADALIVSREPWANDKTRYQWQQTFTVHAASIRHLKCDEITNEHIIALLQPIWQKIPVAAVKTLGRIRQALDAAKAAKLRDGENPAVWTGNISLFMTRPKKLTSRGHHMALPYAELPAFMVRLRDNQSISAQALEFTILTVLRTTEVTGAKWSEVDIDKKVWTVPAVRMKRKILHRVALSEAAIALLKTIRDRDGAVQDAFIFPGRSASGSLSNMAMTGVLQRLGVKDRATVHGMRSSFRDWVSEESDYRSELAEIALSHLVGSEVERAYARGDRLERRYPLMNAWAEYLSSPG